MLKGCDVPTVPSNPAMGFESVTVNETTETKLSIGSNLLIKCGDSQDDGLFLYKVGNIDFSDNSDEMTMENMIKFKDSTGINK